MARVDGEVDEKSAIFRVEFLHDSGEVIAGRHNISFNPKTGTYAYIGRNIQDGLFQITLKAPVGASKARLTIQKWKDDGEPAPVLGPLLISKFKNPRREKKKKPRSGFDAPFGRLFSSSPTKSTFRPRADLEIRARNGELTEAELEDFALHQSKTILHALAASQEPLDINPDSLAQTMALRAMSAFSGHAEVSSSKKLSQRYFLTGDIAHLETLPPDRLAPKARLQIGRKALLDWSAKLGKRGGETFEVDHKRIAYLVQNCLPHHSGGYAMRAHGLCRGYIAEGWDTTIYARPGYPADRKRDETAAPRKTIDGVKYRYLAGSLSVDNGDQIGYVKTYSSALLKEFQENPPGAIHAASFYQNAFAGRLAADEIGCPMIYEMRGMDWLTKCSFQPSWAGTEQYHVQQRLELAAAQCADHVFAITKGLRDWLIKQGVDGSKISLLPNGCMSESVGLLEPDPAYKAELGIEPDAFVVGYIGSVVFYEGVEIIAEAADLAERMTDRPIRLLLVGDGPQYASVLENIAPFVESGVVKVLGRVPHDAVPRCYSVVDVLALARHNLPVCQMISPLKPVEAMSMGKPVLSSDVAAITEMISASKAGYVYPAGDAGALAELIAGMAGNQSELETLSKRALAWAANERTWKVLASKSLQIYQTS